MDRGHSVKEVPADLEVYTLSFLLVQEMDVDPPFVALVDFCGEFFHCPAHLEYLSTNTHGLIQHRTSPHLPFFNIRVESSTRTTTLWSSSPQTSTDPRLPFTRSSKLSKPMGGYLVVCSGRGSGRRGLHSSA